MRITCKWDILFVEGTRTIKTINQMNAINKNGNKAYLNTHISAFTTMHCLIVEHISNGYSHNYSDRSSVIQVIREIYSQS